MTETDKRVQFEEEEELSPREKAAILMVALGKEAAGEVMKHLADFEIEEMTQIITELKNLPTAIQEAMACGCITVSTRHAGIPEAIDEGETGFLVDEHDAAGFTRAIAAAFAVPDTSAMGSKARQVAEERFDNDVLLAKLEREIRRTLGQ